MAAAKRLDNYGEIGFINFPWCLHDARWAWLLEVLGHAMHVRLATATAQRHVTRIDAPAL